MYAIFSQKKYLQQILCAKGRKTSVISLVMVTPSNLNQFSNSVTGKFRRKVCCNTHTHTTVLRPFFWDQPLGPVPEEINFFWTQRKITEADTPAIRLGSTPSRLISDPPPSFRHFYAGSPFCRNPPTLSWPGRGTKCWLARPVAQICCKVIICPPRLKRVATCCEILCSRNGHASQELSEAIYRATRIVRQDSFT